MSKVNKAQISSQRTEKGSPERQKGLEEFRKAPHRAVRCACMDWILNSMPKILRVELQDRSLPRSQLVAGWCIHETDHNNIVAGFFFTSVPGVGCLTTLKNEEGDTK